jgi:diguanylate cyclase (GGDEF)-like protein
MPLEPRKVLVVDDDRLIREMFRDYLSTEDVVVEVAGRGSEALEIVERGGVSVVVADLMMPGMGGLEMLDRFVRQKERPEVIIVTSYGTVESAVRALRLGAFEYLQKPVGPETLRSTLQRAIEAQRIRARHPTLRRHVELHEVCRRLLYAQDHAKLVAEALAGMAVATGARRTLLVSWEWGKADCQLSAAGLGAREAAELARFVEDVVLQGAPDKPIVAEGPLGSPMLVAPLSRGEVSAAIVGLDTERDGYGPAEVADAAYLAEHLSLALFEQLRAGEERGFAFVDELTGLYNARYFDKLVGREVGLAQGGEGTNPRVFSVLVLNIDHIRQVNDRYGHLTGSKVLVEMGRVLRRCVREVDPVFRYSADDFALLLRGADRQAALHVAERVRRSIETHPFLSREGLDLNLTACIGMASFPDHARSKEALIDLAEAALRRAKREGRNAVQLADAEEVAS